MELQHTGPAATLTANDNLRGRGIRIVHADGRPPVQIRISADLPRIHMFCPSVEGDVMWVSLEDGTDHYFDCFSGEKLTIDQVAKRDSHFWQ